MRIGTIHVDARRLWAYLSAPGALLLVFLIGWAATPAPALPRAVASSLGPTVEPIGTPVSLEIPSLEAKAPIVPIDLKGNVFVPPANVRKVGWWRGGAEPGSTTGQTLLSGHAAHAGYSPLNKLHEIRRGATISIRSQDKKVSYVVRHVFTWSKKKVGQHSDDLFDPDYHDRRLVLVTSADFDGRKWNANVIVFAYPN